MNSSILFLLFHFVFLIFGLPDSLAGQPTGYQEMTACEKQKILWDEITVSKHQRLPKISSVGIGTIMRMGMQVISTKAGNVSDFTPDGWVKYLHRRGVVAKVKFVPANDHPYTGIFRSGTECSILRLSITGTPSNRLGFAPGLAWKVLRSGIPSVNVSALYTLEGQDENYNFLKNPLSNIVPVGDDRGKKIVHWIFSRVTDYPEELKINAFARRSEQGVQNKNIKSPRQVFFIPIPNSGFSELVHDFRTDFISKIKAGTALYEVRAASEDQSDFKYHLEYSNSQIETLVSKSDLLGRIITTSDFIASEFGDTGVFFRHEVVRKTK